MLRLNTNEIYQPKEVSLFTACDPTTGETPVLRDATGNAVAVIDDLSDLAAFTDPSQYSDYYLDLPGDSAEENSNVYEDLKNGYDNTIYATIVKDPASTTLALQYWFPYYCSNWKQSVTGGLNNHEGDWEGITLFLNEDGPYEATYYQHVPIPLIYAGQGTRPWDEVELADDDEGYAWPVKTHPVVYVGHGSHASYFESDITDVPVDLDPIPIDIFPDHHEGDGRWLRPGELSGGRRGGLGVEVLPRDLSADLDAANWLRFPGHWGQQDLEFFGFADDGPQGPAFHDGWHADWDPETLTVSGRVQYADLEDGGAQRPLAGATVRLMDNEPVGSRLLCETATNGNGTYAFTGIVNYDGLFQGGLDLYVEVILESSVAEVEQGTYTAPPPNSSRPGSWDSDGVYTWWGTDAGEGHVDGNVDGSDKRYDIAFSQGHEFNGAAEVFTKCHEAYDWVLANSSQPERETFSRDRGPLRVRYDSSQSGTAFHSVRGLEVFGWSVTLSEYLMIFNDDVWNSSTVYHEYGHAAHYSARSGSGMPSGTGPRDHYYDSESSPGFAVTEGWAEFLEHAISDNHILETNNYWMGEDASWDDTNDNGNTGEIVEGAVASIFWDLYDGSSYEEQVDSLFHDLWTVFLNDDPDSIWNAAGNDDFYHYWNARFGQDRAVDEIYIDHGVPVADDRYSGNHSHGDAQYVRNTDQTLSDLMLTDRDDWFSFYVVDEAMSGSQIALEYDARGSIDFEVLDLSGTSVGTVTEGISTATCDLSGLQAGPYFVHVFSAANDMSPNYSLVFDLNEAPVGTNVDVVEVIDRSGSMSGEIGQVKDAAKLFVDLMNPGDKIGVVSYSSGARTDFPLTLITDASATPRAVFNDGMESLNYWTADHPWGLTTTSHGGAYAVTDSPAGDYSNHTNAALTLNRPVNLPADETCSLSFWTRYEIESGWDNGYIEVSDGSGWDQVGGVTGYQSGWTERTYSLAGYEGQPVRVRFRFDTDGSVTRDGWYIDDVRIHTGGGDTKSQAKAAIDSIGTGGMTSIGAGIQGADQQLDRFPGDPVRAMLVMTDGQHNTSPHPYTVIDNQVDGDIVIYTIGFGSGADAGLLGEIADRRNGQYYYAPTRDELREIYFAIGGALTGQQPVVSTSGTIRQNEEVAQNVPVDASSSQATFAVDWSGSDIDLTLIAPDGTVIDHDAAMADPDITLSIGGTYEVYRVNSPLPGQWQMRLVGTSIPASGEDYRAYATVQSPIQMEMTLDQAAYETGELVHITADLDDGMGIAGATVVAAVDAPPGAACDGDYVKLYDDGMHGDGAAGDGTYANDFRRLCWTGTYTLSVDAQGTSNAGIPFNRNTFQSIVASAGADSDGDGLPNVWEDREGTERNRRDSAVDADDDGLTHLDEYFLGTVPFASDTDGDGFSDGAEDAANTNPLDPDSVPTGLVDVSGWMQLFCGRGSYDRRTREIILEVTVRHRGPDPLEAPTRLLITGISDPSITVANADGVSGDGLPYFELGPLMLESTFDPRETCGPVAVRFANPRGLRFGFDFMVRGTLASGASGGPRIEPRIAGTRVADSPTAPGTGTVGATTASLDAPALASPHHETQGLGTVEQTDAVDVLSVAPALRSSPVLAAPGNGPSGGGMWTATDPAGLAPRVGGLARLEPDTAAPLAAPNFTRWGDEPQEAVKDSARPGLNAELEASPLAAMDTLDVLRPDR